MGVVQGGLGARRADPVDATSACARAGTVHLGGTLEPRSPRRSATPGRDGSRERPFVLLAQPTLFDPTRAPAGRHMAWAYCHVPHGSTVDMLPRIERQIERFAPGFRDRVLARHVMTPADIEAPQPEPRRRRHRDGAMDWRQLFIRPTWRNYSTPARGLYLCSASTPPGVGVHGMCGYFAAQAALPRARWRERGPIAETLCSGFRVPGGSGFRVPGRDTQTHAGSATEPDGHARRDATCGSPVVRRASGSERSAGGRDCRATKQRRSCAPNQGRTAAGSRAPSAPSWRCAAGLRKMNSRSAVSRGVSQ